MGPEDRINTDNEIEPKNGEIPGLDLDPNSEEGKKAASKKVPYSKPIPRNFQAQWNEIEGEENTEQVEALNAIVNQLIETTPGAVPLNDVTPEAIILYGRVIPVEGKKIYINFVNIDDNKFLLRSSIKNVPYLSRCFIFNLKFKVINNLLYLIRT